MSRWLANGGDEMTFVLESAGEPKSLESSLRHALARADTRLAVDRITSLDQAAAESWVTERFLFVLVSLFGALGVVLASIGVYGLLALQVARRTRVFTLAESLGAVESLIEHPGRMTHASVAGSALEVPASLLRLSVGLETIDDLVRDLQQALQL